MKTSRFGRIGKLATLATDFAGSAVQSAVGVLAHGKSFPSGFHARTAGQLFEKLAEMKGLPMKVGQILSYMDGVLPPEHQQIYRDSLAKLQIHAKPHPWSAMEKELQTELGEPVESAFATFEKKPVAAASIGQVFRARLKSGEPVAVKIQYPGIADAVKADLANVRSILSLLKKAAPKIDTEKMAVDMLTRVEEELDYRNEAAHQEQFRRVWQGESHVVIPRVIESFTTQRLLVTSWEEGRTLEEFAQEANQEAKNQVGKTTFRFAFRSILIHGLFNADPHPGNYLVQNDGSVVFLDFGCVQVYDADDRQALNRLLDASLHKAADSHFWQEICDALVLRGTVSEKMKVLMTDYVRFCFQPVTAPQPFTFTKEYTRQISDLTLQLKAEMAKTLFRFGWSEPKRNGLVHFNRILFGLFSILARLEASADWRSLVTDLRE